MSVTYIELVSSGLELLKGKRAARPCGVAVIVYIILMCLRVTYREEGSNDPVTMLHW